MASKRKKPSRSRRATAGSMPETWTSEALETSSSDSTLRACETMPSVPLDPSTSSTRQGKASLSALNKLYYFCTRRPKAHEESRVLVKMFGFYLTRKDSYSLRPKGWLSLMVISAAGKVMMEDEKKRIGVVTRHIFSPLFMNKVICESNLCKEHSYKPWRIEDVSQFILRSRLGYDISQCKLVFAPTLFEEHWSCFAFEPINKTLYVLDSMCNKLSTSKKNLDNATKLRFEELLVLLYPNLTKENATITLVHVDVPMQSNM